MGWWGGEEAREGAGERVGGGVDARGPQHASCGSNKALTDLYGAGSPLASVHLSNVLLSADENPLVTSTREYSAALSCCTRPGVIKKHDSMRTWATHVCLGRHSGEIVHPCVELARGHERRWKGKHA